MIKGRVSVVIPSRNERHLQKTIDSLLTNAAGDVEVIAMLDGGPWPDPPLKDNKRLRVVRNNESIGMRPCENAAAEIATGQYLMKTDAHCIFAPGYDEALKKDCEEDWLAVPTRHSVDGATWTMKGRNWNYHILTYPYLPSMYGAGLHAVTFPWDQNRIINKEREHVRVDDLMSCQGSCWFQHLSNFKRLGPLDHANYYFYGEAIEICMRQWITGGRCVINKNTWYAHLHKGREEGRGFFLSLRRKRESEAYGTDFWTRDRWPGATRTFVSFVEQFWPLLSLMRDERYAWPADWRDFEKHRQAFENRTPEQIPPHL